MLIREALSQGRDRLRLAGIDEAQVECEYMLMKLLNVTRSVLHYDRCRLAAEPSARMDLGSGFRPTASEAIARLTTDQEKQFFDWIESREKRIPLAYLLGDVFFHSLKLKVRAGCLIPRPETERLVEESIQVLKADLISNPYVIDLGSGSGAIALSLLAAMPEAKATLVDLSEEALAVAHENAQELGFLNRAEFVLSDLFSAPYFLSAKKESYDLVVSNPPYLTEQDLKELQPEVAFEPRMALDGGKDGLVFYRRIVREAKNFLKPRGWIAFEVGAGQAADVCEELKKYQYEEIRVFRDYQGIERVVLGRLGSRRCSTAA